MRLGRYLKRVGRGQTFIVTDRHEPVAELRPLGNPKGSLDIRLAAMASLGAITLPTSRRLRRFAPITGKGTTGSEAIRRDRDERY
ncbi:MAG: type II toxin-antitoxin system Phd/YefM family antitoxin [Vicinamibacterales bacterium]